MPPSGSLASQERTARPHAGRGGKSASAISVGAFLHRLGTVLTAAVLALAPLPFGSAEDIWVLLWSLGLAVSLPLLDVRELRKGHIVILAGVLGTFLVTLLVVWLQTVPNPSFLPPNPIWRTAEGLLGHSLPATISVNPARTWSALGLPVLLQLTFLCSFLAASQRTSAATLFSVVSYAGAAYAGYGILAYLFDPNTLLGHPKVTSPEDLTGTFVNRNTAATFFGLVLIVWTVRFLTEVDSHLPKSSARLWDLGAVLLYRPSREMAVSLGCLLLALAALLMTRSRAGVLLSLGSLFMTALLCVRHRLAGRAAAIVLIGAGPVLIGLVLEFLGGGVVGRLGGEGLIDPSRRLAFEGAVAIVRDFPLLGTGLGTFTDMFPAYRSSEISTVGVWDRAHNTLLEIAVELGIPAALLVAAMSLSLLLRLLWGALKRRRDAHFALVGFGTALLGSLHSLVDFSPQIAGFAVPWIGLIACGLAQSFRSERRESRAPAIVRAPVGPRDSVAPPLSASA